MLRRRLVPLLLFAVWLAPAVATGAVVAHDLVEHGHPGALAPSSALAALEHGHAHGEGELDHEHRLALSSAPDLRLARLELPAPAAASPARLDAAPPLAPRGEETHRERTPPPRDAGSALLARIALLRI